MTAPEPIVAGLVLAAGAGTRFGQPKALIEFDGELLVDRSFRLLQAGGCWPVHVVLGASSEQVVGTARLDTASVIVAEDWASGMAASLRSGLCHLADTDAMAVVVTLVDQPWIGADAIRRLTGVWRSGALAAVATYGGEQRNPVLLDRQVWRDVLASATGDIGARGWLRRHPEQVTLVACDETGDPRDVDTVADLQVHNNSRRSAADGGHWPGGLQEV